MSSELLSLEQFFWSCNAIRINDAGERYLVTDRVPGPALKSYRALGGVL